LSGFGGSHWKVAMEGKEGEGGRGDYRRQRS
jgi:hypothetical protein